MHRCRTRGRDGTRRLIAQLMAACSRWVAVLDDREIHHGAGPRRESLPGLGAWFSLGEGL